MKSITRSSPITGATRTQMRPARPVQTTSNTSADAQRQVTQPPQPFANPRGGAQTPVGSVRESAYGQPWDQTSRPGSHPRRSPGSSVMSDAAMLAAVGEPRPVSRAPLDVRNSLKAPRVVGGGNNPMAHGGGSVEIRGRASLSVPARNTGAVRGDGRGMRGLGRGR